MSASLKIAKFSLNDFFSFTEFSLNQTKQKKHREKQNRILLPYIQIDRHTHTPTLENCFIFTFFLLQARKVNCFVVDSFRLHSVIEVIDFIIIFC